MKKTNKLPKTWRWRRCRPFLCGTKMVADWELLDVSECPVRVLVIIARPPCLWQGWSIFDRRGGNWLNGATPRLNMPQAKDFAEKWALENIRAKE